MTHIAQPITEHIAEFVPIAQGQLSIVEYRDRLYSLYTRPDMEYLELDHWKMAELRTCKNKYTGLKKHEYLIATFTDNSEGGHGVHLLIQRQLQNPSSPPTGIDNDDPPIIQLGMRIIDSVRLYTVDNLRDRNTAEHITFREGHRISLPEFIFLACAVRESSRTHSLRRAACNWFCFAIVAALKARYPEHNLLPVKQQQARSIWEGLLCGSVNVNELFARADQMLSHLGQLRIQANVD